MNLFMNADIHFWRLTKMRLLSIKIKISVTGFFLCVLSCRIELYCTDI